MHDPIAAHIFDALYPRRGPVPENTINTIARKHCIITLRPHSTPLTQTCKREHQLSRQIPRRPKHRTPERLAQHRRRSRAKQRRELVTKPPCACTMRRETLWSLYTRKSPGASRFVVGLTEKVDRVIREIVKKEGNAGYGDFKV
jgi:hypothetical protein